ncbi:MAG: hypothetical protein IPO72_07595 [Saprospiraceae bacterium]|nr:hypothetical protein [Candidatus Vicinibacter affinis]MBK7800583.1 hypothetical protein [Candidatus Vicinibacter affinis]MBK9641147.1 hypothetical protein [Candidatus Vicinibacter affinis]
MSRTLITMIFGLSILMGKAIGQKAEVLVQMIQTDFKKIERYTADINISFEIPYINIEPVKGKVYFKQPNLFKVKTQGIAFMPKQNPFYLMELLNDPSSYLCIDSGSETNPGSIIRIIQLVPKEHEELILAKIWVDATRRRIVKSSLTTKSNGTVEIQYLYDEKPGSKLPELMVFGIEVGKFKIPKMMSADLNSRSKNSGTPSQSTHGKIRLKFTNYRLNQSFDEKVFYK